MLKRVSIQNFKSLKDVTLDLQKVNLLIGPNNSGKTNFLKALEFCYSAHASKEIEIELEDDEDGLNKLMVKIHNVNETYNHSIIAFKKDHNSEVYFYLSFDDNSLTQLEWSSNSSRILTQESGGKLSDNEEAVKRLKNNLGEIIIYKPDPNKLILSGPVGTGVEMVNADASNLIGFIDRMLGNKYRKSVFGRIETDLQTCIPEFDEINLDDVTATEELRKQFGDKSFKRIGLTNSEQGITYWADELSEGTLYFLALLCIINQPNPPKLLLLEEPEKGIHPRRIREVMDFMFRLAEEKGIQIILTTHNEHVLDDFATRPESVFVFDKDDEGATYVRNLQKDIIEPINQRNEELGLDPIDLTSNLSENWLYGLLGGVPAIP